MVALDPDIEPAHTFPDLDSFLASTTTPTGHVRIATAPVPVDFRYIDRGSSNLAIFLQQLSQKTLQHRDLLVSGSVEN